jgi:hypothetical protein
MALRKNGLLAEQAVGNSGALRASVRERILGAHGGAPSQR